jgi:hypothetical protein
VSRNVRNNGNGRRKIQERLYALQKKFLSKSYNSLCGELFLELSIFSPRIPFQYNEIRGIWGPYVEEPQIEVDERSGVWRVLT